MRQTTTVSLPKELAQEVDKLARKEKISRSEIIRKSVQNYLFVRKFRALRSRLVVKAQAQGIHTDQDVFDWKLIRARRKQPTLSLGQLKTRLKMKK